MLVVLLGVFAVIGFRAVQKIRAVPDWVEQNQSFLTVTEPKDLERLAKAIEVRTPREWTRPVGSGDGNRTVPFAFDEVNAWLALRLDRVLRNQGISFSGLGGAMLTELDGQLVTTVSHDSGGRLRFYSVFFEVIRAVNDTGAQTQEPAFRLSAIRLGEQSLPLSLISGFIDVTKVKDPVFRDMITDLAAGRAVGPLVLPVDAHRKARIKGFRVTQTGIELDMHVSYNDADASGG